jgi:SAM-dependent methyltransferase
MRQWAADNLEAQTAPIRVLECGSGNGTLLLSFLTSPGPDATPQAFDLTGIDYSAGAVTLGASIEAARRESLEDDMDVDDVANEVTCSWRQGDLLRDDIGETWDLVMDKGTFDALALSQEPVDGSGELPSRVYPQRMARLVRPGGFFLITSCNFTEEEIKSRYTKPELGFTFQYVYVKRQH